MSNKLEQLELKLEKLLGFGNLPEQVRKIYVHSSWKNTYVHCTWCIWNVRLNMNESIHFLKRGKMNNQNSPAIKSKQNVSCGSKKKIYHATGSNQK